MNNEKIIYLRKKCLVHCNMSRNINKMSGPRTVVQELMWPSDKKVWRPLPKSSRGVTRGGKGGTIPRAPNHYGGAKSLREAPNHCGRRQMTAGSPKSPNNVTNTFLQYSTFASGRPQVRTWERPTCFLPRAPSNLVTPLKASHTFETFSQSLHHPFRVTVFANASFSSCGTWW